MRPDTFCLIDKLAIVGVQFNVYYQTNTSMYIILEDIFLEVSGFYLVLQHDEYRSTFDRFDLVNILCHIIIDDILEAVLDWQFGH